MIRRQLSIYWWFWIVVKYIFCMVIWHVRFVYGNFLSFMFFLFKFAFGRVDQGSLFMKPRTETRESGVHLFEMSSDHCSRAPSK